MSHTTFQIFHKLSSVGKKIKELVTSVNFKNIVASIQSGVYNFNFASGIKIMGKLHWLDDNKSINYLQ